MSNTSVLYITYDGITDHIGQSQVAPYLMGLAAKGHRIALLSAEKMERSAIIEKYKKLFAAAGVEWHYVAYHKKPPVLSTVMDLRKMQGIAKKIIAKNNVTIVHCRSYVASLIGLHFKKKYGIRFIFDMRDFWPDAAKEIKRFDVDNNRIHKAVYQFFKKKEKEFIEQADHIISLTESGKRVMQGWNKEGYVQLTAPVTVIPCCADFSVFDRSTLDGDRLAAMRAKLGIGKDDFVLNYLGSLGPSYLTDEMMDLFKVLLRKKPNAKFLIVANNDHHLAIEAAKRKGIDASKIIVTKGNKEEVPYLIAQSNLSLFFIIPSFAKQACSPTKLAELLAMNVPVIANTKVGDLDAILNPDVNNSEVVRSFTEEEYDRVLDDVLAKIDHGNEHIRNCSTQFSLEKGIELYNGVYNQLANN
jgi:glycosyltransferase involved in cell wall biosynthesis